MSLDYIQVTFFKPEQIRTVLLNPWIKKVFNQNEALLHLV